MSTVETINEYEYLSLNVKNNNIVIPLDYIDTIRLIQEVTPIPRSPDYVLGVVTIEDAIIPIIDVFSVFNGDKNNIKNLIVIIISLEDSTYGIVSSTLPRVIKSSEIAKPIEQSYFPNEWVAGALESGELVLNPKNIWDKLELIAIS